MKTSDFVFILMLIFVTAKITGQFDHSWWIVFAPLLIYLALEAARSKK